MSTSTLSFNEVPDELKIWVGMVVFVANNYSRQGESFAESSRTFARSLRYAFGGYVTSDQQEAIVKLIDQMNLAATTNEPEFINFCDDAFKYYARSAKSLHLVSNRK